jgi:hypothetical protein
MGAEARSLADVLRQAIRASGVSQQEISRRTGIPAPVLSRFLSGKRPEREENKRKRHYGHRSSTIFGRISRCRLGRREIPRWAERHSQSVARLLVASRKDHFGQHQPLGGPSARRRGFSY